LVKWTSLINVISMNDKLNAFSNALRGNKHEGYRSLLFN